MKEFVTCNSFNDDYEIEKSFSIFQKELLPIQNMMLKPGTVEYKCEWFPVDVDIEKPFAIIPIKDSSELLKYTLENLEKNNFFDEANVIVVDDRSVEDLHKIVQEHPVSFLKTYNDVGFNFSMLNNIAALVCHKIGAKRIILWNSDLWIDKIEYFKQLIQLHEKEDSTISGSKLLYPVVSLHENHSPNIKKHFPDKLDGSYKDTVQFGGSRWVPSSFSTNKGQIHTFLPYHYKRFSNKNNPLVNSNYATVFVTGALQVIELDWFISIGGLNPSLSKNFQDVDLCLRAIENEKKVMYFGKDIHFYHDESYTFYKVGSKKQEEINSNQAFFSTLWKDKIPKIIF